MARGGPGGLAGNTQVSSAMTKLLTGGASGYRWAAATVGAESAAPFQLASREPIMAIGGFNGTDAAPSLAEFKQMVAAHEIHYFIGANSDTFGGGAADAEAITTLGDQPLQQGDGGRRNRLQPHPPVQRRRQFQLSVTWLAAAAL